MKRLKFEVLPPAIHSKNVRSELGQAEWDVIRKKTYKKYNHTCSICGKTHMRCNAHEVWKLVINSKMFTGKQILVNVINVCNECHDVIHIVRLGTIAPDKVPEAIKYYAKINGIDFQDAIVDYNYMGEKLQRTSNIRNWTIDLSILDNDKYLQVFNIN